MARHNSHSGNESSMKDRSLHGLLVALGMSITIAAAVVLFAYGASRGTLFQEVVDTLSTTFHGQLEASLSAAYTALGDLLQLITTAIDSLSSKFG